MNYKIITNKNKLLEFIDWLPELTHNEVYYVSLFARKKYCKELHKSNDNAQLARFTCKKNSLFRNIKKLETKEGNYLLRDKIAPQESLALYININPRCERKATELLAHKCIELMGKNEHFNLIRKTYSCIQQSKSRTVWKGFDIDTKDVNFKVLDRILPTWSGVYSYKILETRGGYHLLVNTAMADNLIQINNEELKTNYNKNWYSEIMHSFPIDQSSDQLSPIPGTYQGGFTPKFIKI